MNVPTSGTDRLTCAPVQTRDRMSRPRLSVPHRNSVPPSSTPISRTRAGMKPISLYGSLGTKKRMGYRAVRTSR